MVTGTRTGIDIGGTFTDVVLAAHDGRVAVRKLLSTPDDFARAAIEGLRAAAVELGLEPACIRQVVHATTVATNAIVEHRGAECALVTTEGFRDVLEIGRLRIPRLYDLFYDKRRMLVPRRRIFEVRERIAHSGEVLEPLDPASCAAAVEGAIASGATSIAVSLINAYANPAHERAVAAAIRARAPDLELSASSDIAPQIGEFERTSTTVVNAYVKPIARGYLQRLRTRLGDAGVSAPLYIMQCAGALTTEAIAAEQPVTMIESGPAAGVLAAARGMAGTGLANLVSFDMGGTTAKAAVIENGRVTRTREFEVGGAISATTRLTGGGGYPVNVPVVDVAEVGAGGGSIAWIDDGGGLRVGPVSAGASPGPACYGLGGGAPTVTDANVVLGYLNPSAIAGGAIAIDPRRAEAVIASQVAGPLGLDTLAAAYGVHLIANSEMMGAIRAVTTQRGRDLRDFVLVAFGGCGPVHAVTLAREAGIAEVIVPPAPGVFSAHGLLALDIAFERSAMLYLDLADLEQARIDAVLSALRDEVLAIAAGGADAPATLEVEVEADLHYWGQSHELTVSVPFAPFDETRLRDLGERFETEHERTYGHRASGERVILVGVRVIGRAPAAAAVPVHGTGETARTAPGVRRAWFGERVGFADAAVVGRASLGAEPRGGPLLVEEYDTVIVVPPGADARLDAEHNVRIRVGVAPASV